MKIITTVGTSLITNEPKSKDYGLDKSDYTADLFDRKEDSSSKKSVRKLIADLEDKATKGGTKSCAEIASIDKIDLSGQAEIYLLCTETVLSRACGEALKNYFGERVKEVKVIEGLQVKNAKIFEDSGFLKLIEKVKEIKNNEQDVCLNISGGYKALIPPLTLFAQLEKIPLFYLFEESEELIETGNLPISFDWEAIEEFSMYLHNKNKRDKASDETIDKMRKLKLVKSDSHELTIVGSLISKYSEQASPFTETIFGYFIEHKVFECYANEYGKDKVEHSVKAGKGSEDIDILITCKEDEFIPVEIKPAYVLNDEDRLCKIKKAFIYRVNTVKTERGKPREIWLLTYSYSDSKNDAYNLGKDECELLKKVEEDLRREIDQNLQFRVKHFFIEKNKLGSERHVYQTFMKTTLKVETIKDLFFLR
jgi:putative CRISPR-associated protein (TIGR02619 family)